MSVNTKEDGHGCMRLCGLQETQTPHEAVHLLKSCLLCDISGYLLFVSVVVDLIYWLRRKWMSPAYLENLKYWSGRIWKKLAKAYSQSP